MIATSEAPAQRRYRLIAEIGRGGMAEVYLAVSQGPGGFNKLVVIKKALQGLALQPEILSMFMDEARLAARMNHPNVVQTYELGEENGLPFIAMEYLDGQPYSRVLARMRNRTGGPEPMQLAHHLRVLLDTLAGLHHAHELRDFNGTPLHVVHRDVSPHNVFVTYDGSIKVVDFGIAKAQDSSSRTVTGDIKGKVPYMSPEQARGEPLDRRSDLFAVGIMLWEAVAGRRMWQEIPDITVIHELLHGRIPSIRAAAPYAPPDLASIIDRALAPDREGRYPSALAMQRDLEAFAVTSGARADGPEVGLVVSELFDPDRRRVRAVVEAQLGSLRWTGENPAAASLPQIPPPLVPGQESTGSLGARMATGSAAAVGPISVAPTNSGTALPMPATAAPSRRSALVLGLLGVAAASLTAAVVVTIVREREGAGRPAAAQATTAEPKSPATADAVSLKVKASPADAKIYLDGALLGAGSFEGKVPRGEVTRVLRVEAEGYQTKEESFVPSADMMTSFALEKSAEAVPSASASAGTAPLGGRPFVPRPKPTGRDIDSESPYKNP